VLLLIVSIGLPFLLLSSTTPLLQRWVSLQDSSISPYRLYALSNGGSLLALLTYPFLVEPVLGLHSQSLLWSLLYVGFVAGACWCGIILYRSAPVPQLKPCNSDEHCPTSISLVHPDESPSFRTRLLWLLLSGCGVLLLVATTNQMTQDLAPVPFLWLLPLSVYLLSFIICFHRDRWYDRRVWTIPLFISLIAALFLLFEGPSLDIRIQIVVYAMTLFFCCMVCHGELARLKPKPRHLTAFYLFMALGGSIGGLFVPLGAPKVFGCYWEYHSSLFATYLLFTLCVLLEKGILQYLLRHPIRTSAFVTGACVLGMALLLHIKESSEGAITSSRNFYGVLKVHERGRDTPDWRRYLWLGQVKQGGQQLQIEKRRQTTVYYGPESGLAVAAHYYPQYASTGILKVSERPRGLHIGAVGLGVGTVAAYGRYGDTIRFYEINPEVVRIAQKYFTYLLDSPARVDIVLGDARMSMERELVNGHSQGFDILVLDAFNSDAVPMHLLTREAFELYWQHLKPNGILAVHTSTFHLDLKQVVLGIAEALHKKALVRINRPNRLNSINWSEWVLVTNNETFLNDPRVDSYASSWTSRKASHVVWTDDYGNLLDVVQ